MSNFEQNFNRKWHSIFLIFSRWNFSQLWALHQRRWDSVVHRLSQGICAKSCIMSMLMLLPVCFIMNNSPTNYKWFNLYQLNRLHFRLHVHIKLHVTIQTITATFALETISAGPRKIFTVPRNLWATDRNQSMVNVYPVPHGPGQLFL